MSKDTEEPNGVLVIRTGPLDTIKIGENVYIQVEKTSANACIIRIQAPKSIKINRIKNGLQDHET